MRKYHNKTSRGFTLVELLVVVAIIAILAAIALPQFARYRQSAFRNAVRSDIRNAVSAIEAFVANYGGYPNSPATCGPVSTGTTTCDLSDGTNTDAGAIVVSRNVQLQFNWITDCGTAGGPAGAPGYEIIGTHTQISGWQASYNSCTGQYTNF